MTPDPAAVRRARARVRMVGAVASLDPQTDRLPSPFPRSHRRPGPVATAQDRGQLVEAPTDQLPRVPARRPGRSVVRASWAVFGLAVLAFYLVPVGAALNWW